MLDCVGAVLLLNQSTCFKHLTYKILCLLSCLKLTLTLSQLPFQCFDSFVFSKVSLELAFLQRLELVNLRLCASTFRSCLTKHGRISLLRRDGCGITNDFQKLRVYLYVEILTHSQRLIPFIHLLFHEVCELTADDSVANVYEPLKESEDQIREFNTKNINHETYLSWQRGDVTSLRKVVTDLLELPGKLKDFLNAERRVKRRVEVLDLARFDSLLLLCQQCFDKVNVDRLIGGEKETTFDRQETKYSE